MGDSLVMSIWRRLTGRPARRAELDDEEMAEVVDRQTRNLLNLDASTFADKLKSGELDRRDWRVEYLSGLVE